jgi:hypothetical protein
LPGKETKQCFAPSLISPRKVLSSVSSITAGLSFSVKIKEQVVERLTWQTKRCENNLWSPGFGLVRHKVHTGAIFGMGAKSSFVDMIECERFDAHILGIPLAHKITYYKTNVFAALKCNKIQNESQDIARYQAISPSITVKLRCKNGNYWETQAVLGNYCAQVTNHLQLATIWLPCCSFGTHLEPQAQLLPGPSVAPVEQTERGNLPTTSLDRWQWEQRYIHCKAGKTMKFSMQQLPN